MEPNVSDAAVAALWAPTAGIVNPFQLTCALAESAAANGVEFRLGERVCGLSCGAGGSPWQISTNEAQLTARVVVNAAGIASHDFTPAASATPAH